MVGAGMRNTERQGKVVCILVFKHMRRVFSHRKKNPAIVLTKSMTGIVELRRLGEEELGKALDEGLKQQVGCVEISDTLKYIGVGIH
jgi:hypothetical protein